MKPSLRTSRVVASWPVDVRYFWVLLWGYLDDEGRGLDIPKTIAGDCYPLDDAVTAYKVDRWLTVIAATRVAGREPPLCRYEVGGARYLHAVNWTDNQKVNRPRPSMNPPCPFHELFTDSGSEDGADAALRPHVLEGGRGKKEEGGGSARGEPFTETAPPSWCPKHPGGTETPCRACGQARIAAVAWEAEQALAKRARQAEIDAAPRCGTCGHSVLGAYHQRSCDPAALREDATHV